MHFTYTRQVFAFECDIYGHLNNANYLHLYEEARAVALVRAGFSIAKLKQIGLSIYVVDASIFYLAPVYIEDICTIKSHVSQMNRVKSIWEQSIFVGEKQCSKIVLKAAFAKDSKPCRVDKPIFEKLKRSFKNGD